MALVGPAGSPAQLEEHLAGIGDDHRPTIRAALAQDRVAEGATRAVAAWVLHLRGLGAPVIDTRSAELAELVSGDEATSVHQVLGFLGIDDERVAAAVTRQMNELRDAAATKENR